jgi:hypothetical protein
MPRLIAKNWHDFQHYKDRAPAWIKLHKKLIDDFEYQCLPIASKALAPMLWLLASEENDGSIDYSPVKIAFRLRMTEGDVVEAVKPLIDAGFFALDGECYQPASTPLAACLPREREEKEKEIEKRREETEKREKSAQRAAQLPADFYPDATGVTLAESLSIPFAAELEKFRDYHKARGKPMKDWQSAWRTWARNANQFAKERGQVGRAPIRATTGRQAAISNYAAQAAAARGENHDEFDAITVDALRIA